MNEVLQAVLNEKIIVICRGLYNEELHSTVEALFKGGIRCFEVTFDQSDSDCENKTFNAIRMLVEYFPEAYIGAGTVITKSQLMKAYDAGAKYIISPNTNASIIEQTKKLGLLSVPGATTPSEILQAHEYGADIVKIFPSNALGIKYISDLMGPLNHIKFLVAAGINEDNINDYSRIGCVGFGISGRLTDRTLIKNKCFNELTKRAENMISKL